MIERRNEPRAFGGQRVGSDVALVTLCRLTACAIVLEGILALYAPEARAAFEFGTVPKLPALTNVAINGKSQIVNTTMTNFSVIDTRGTKSGWNITAQGQSGAGKSAVFAQYCPKAKCAGQSEGYIAGGAKMAAASLKLSSTGAKFSGGSGATPTLQCAAACNLDGAAAVKIASATTAESTWTTSGFSATSLALAVPTTLLALPAEEIYRVNVLWTLATGP